MRTAKLYLVNTYEAYRADEIGVKASIHEPIDTIDYKHEVIAEDEIILPIGFELCETSGHGQEFFHGDNPCEMVTEQTSYGYVTSLVSSEGITPIKKWNI